MKWTPSFQWFDGVVIDLAFALPVAIWRHQDRTIGGEIESDAAYPAAYTVRDDYLLALPLRFFESEWPLVRALIEFGQTAGVIRWYPSIEDDATYFDVYLDAPALGTDISPIPDAIYPRALVLQIVIRRVDGAAFPLEYFGEATGS